MNVRTWWDQARECDQEAVIMRLGLDRSLVGIPWVFLPEEAQCILVRRVRINAGGLDPDWQRAKHN
jgi:hypothetical protein